jgi:hypothetical protein
MRSGAASLAEATLSKNLTKNQETHEEARSVEVDAWSGA